MTPAAPWHPGDEVLQAYVDGTLPGVPAGSVEAHLMACSDCRATLREGVDPDRLVRLRQQLDDRLDGFERPWLERFLIRVGLDEADTRALLAAPSLRRAWWLAVLAAAALGIVVARDAQNPDGYFLVFAPLLPLVATAAAYAPVLDPAFALVAATPYRTMRLLLARSLAVGSTSLLGVTAAALALPAHDVAAVGWLLPTIALTLLVLSLAPRFGTGPAATGVAFGWVLAAASLHHRGMDMTWMSDTASQLAAALLATIALAVLAHQWNRLDVRGTA